MRHQKCLFDLPEADLAEILRDLALQAERLKGQRIFISGGTGFFGKWLVGALAFADDELDLHLQQVVLSRNPARLLEEYPETSSHRSLEFHQGEIQDFESPAGNFDLVIHGATDTLDIVTPAQEEKRARAIIQGTERMLQLARERGARRFLNISSGGIYGAAAGRPSGAREDDDASAKPVSTYGRAKLDAERRCFASGVSCGSARAFAFLGPHLPLDAHYAAGNFLRDAHGGGPILVHGDGTALRSYLYPTDLVIWQLRILLQGAPARAYNVGSDEVVSTGDLARRIAALSPTKPEVTIQSAQANGPQNIYLPDIARARAELGVQVQVNLDDAIRRSLAWLNQTVK